MSEISELKSSIEALIAERDALFRRATLAEEWRDHDKTRAEAAEAKLAKAVGGVKRICMQPDYRLPSPQEIARATLAEIKSHSDEFAAQKGESNYAKELKEKLAKCEARLGKAVGALKMMCEEFRGYDLPYGSKAYSQATATLAEIKGESHE